MSKGLRLLMLSVAGMLSAVLMMGGVMVPTAPSAHARTLQDLEDQRERNRQEREEVKASLEGTDDELAQVYLDLDDTRRQLSEARTELEIRQSEYAAADRELQTVRDRLQAAQAEKDDLTELMARDAEEMDLTEAAMGDVARSAYRGTGNISALSIVLNAGSLQEFADSYSAMNSALRNQGLVLGELRDGNVVNENQHARLQAVEERIEDLEIEAEELLEIAEEKRAAANTLVNRVESLERQQEEQAEKLEDSIAESNARLSELETEDSSIASDIAKIEEEERKRKQEEDRKRREREEAAQAARPTPSPKPVAPPTKPKPPVTSGRTGALIPPISRSLFVTSPWGYRVYPITGGWFMHNGVDLRSGCGERQFASAAGTVTSVRGAIGNGTHGNQVFINHGNIDGNNYVTVYNHLSGFAVSQGQYVTQGQTIGYTGATGKVTGCHVHFEVWRNGQTIDPMTLPAFR